MNPTFSRLFRITASDRAREFDGHHPDDEDTTWGPFDGHVEDTEEVPIPPHKFVDKDGGVVSRSNGRRKPPSVCLRQISDEAGLTHVIVFSRDDPNEFEVRYDGRGILSCRSSDATKALAAGNARRRRVAYIS